MILFPVPHTDFLFAYFVYNVQYSEQLCLLCEEYLLLNEGAAIVAPGRFILIKQRGMCYSGINEAPQIVIIAAIIS